MTAPICPYCGQESELVTGDVLYRGRGDLATKFFYRCARCDASVGCHPGGRKPLGTLANRELRQKRQAAHAEFDPLWKKGAQYQVFNSRSNAYAWLAIELGMEDGTEAHIGSADSETCEQIIASCRKVQLQWEELGGNRQALEQWLVDRMERAEIVREELAAEKAGFALIQAEAQRAKFASDTRWGSW